MDVIASRKNPFVASVRRVADGEDRDRVLLDGLQGYTYLEEPPH